MPLLSTDLIVYKAINNTSNVLINGGILSTNPSASAIRGNVFPDVSDTERDLGSIMYRKVFWKNDNNTNLILHDTKVYMTTYTPADDWVTMLQGTFTDIENEIAVDEREYGAAALQIDVYSTQTSTTVTVENTNLNLFYNGDSIWIGDDSNNEMHDNVGISKNGINVTITLDAGDAFINNFDHNTAVLSSILSTNDLAPVTAEINVTASTGIVDTNTYPIQLYNKGCMSQIWTLQFSSASQYSCSGNTFGYIGNGDINTDFSPTNTIMASPYFFINKNMWQGTWQGGDSVIFVTTPAATSIWFKRTIPSGSENIYNSFQHTARGYASIA